VNLGLTPQAKHLSPLRGSLRSIEERGPITYLMADGSPGEPHDFGAGAPEARKIHSLGREPQVRGDKKMNKPRSGDRKTLPRELLGMAAVEAGRFLVGTGERQDL